jgi:hypothetical protein
LDDEVEEFLGVDVFFKHEAVVVFPDLLKILETHKIIKCTWYIFAGKNFSRL